MYTDIQVQVWFSNPEKEGDAPRYDKAKEYGTNLDAAISYAVDKEDGGTYKVVVLGKPTGSTATEIIAH